MKGIENIIFFLHYAGKCENPSKTPIARWTIKTEVMGPILTRAKKQAPIYFTHIFLAFYVHISY